MRVSRLWLWLMLAIVLVPVLATLVVATSVSFISGPYTGGFTLDWLGVGFSLLAPTLLHSAQVGLTVAAANLIVGGPLAWWVARSSSRFARIVGYLATVPLAVPGIAISVALIGSYSGLRPSGLLLLAGHIIFTLPFTLAALVPVLSSDRLRECEQVAYSLGASGLRRVLTITIPWCLVAIIQAAAMSYALSFGEFNISFFVNAPANPTAPFALFDAYQTRRLELASAMSIWFIVSLLPVFAALVLLRTRITERVTT
ncbi:MAG: ABC transporter permease subunit [Propionibacteriaceae bacterium]|nr:ABC transporter permease subunit [Propionibacteriaceae bacterium]